MIKTATLMTLAYGAPADGAVLDVEDSRRYSQLMAWMESYNPSFDDRKYWAYGCHCLMLGKGQENDNKEENLAKKLERIY